MSDKLKDTAEYKAMPFKMQWSIDKFVDYYTETKAEIDRLNRQIESLSNFQPAQKLKEYIAYPATWENVSPNNSTYWHSLSSYYTQRPRPILTGEDLDKWLAQNEVIYKENVEICKNNAKVKEIVFKFLDNLGLQRKKYDYPTLRSKTKAWVPCYWVGEIDAFFTVSCDYDWNRRKEFVVNEKKAINNYWTAKKQEEEQSKKAKETELKNQEKNALIVKLVEKYNLTFDSPIPPVNDVIAQLAKKNKYLYLARYMAKNRSDWNDGPSYAEQGLDFFISQKDKVTQELDSKIYSEVSEAISDWGGDGRVFRDLPTYNYDVIFGIAEHKNKELYEDYCKLVNYEEGY
jgi:hypothetical protein